MVKQDLQVRTTRPANAIVEIKHLLKKQRALMLWGPPGIGKSDIIQLIGDQEGREVIDLRLLLMEPTDLRGIPYYNKDKNCMDWAPPVDLPNDPKSNAILFLDEMNAAPPAVQAAAYQLILNRRIGNYVLPKDVSIVAAGNRETDRGVTYRMPSPLANRMVHIEMEVHFEDWLKWATTNEVHPDVVGYLSFAKQDLYDFDPASSSRGFATPRSWSFVSELIDDSLNNEQMTDLITGAVGEGLAVKFQAHRKIAGQLPNPEEILKGKVKSLKTKEISAMYTLITSMCYELKDECEKAQKSKKMDGWHKQADCFLKFMMDNFETEMVVLGARTALKTYQLPFSPKHLKSFDEFYKRYGSLIVEA
tara:strand:+ start:3589 stop:4674 length:1086 start_codon:yes stop_codon:yes gene_type:complete